MASTIEPSSTEQFTQATFRPRARLVSLLGEQLISDSAVGILELVKNAYDADATRADIVLEHLGDAEKTRICLRDNGHGMDRGHLLSRWLSPATGNKEARKRDKQRTGRGRQLTGEKGVGRFAVQRLGYELRLVTRVPGGVELELFVDWRAFEKQGAFLDEVSVDVIEREEPIEFKGDAHGTLLDIRGARTPWDGHVLRKVQRLLRRLQTPVTQGNDFSITLTCKEFPQYEDIDPSSILSKAHYAFEGSINEQGQLEWQYSCNQNGIERTSSGKENLCALGDIAKSQIEALCGPFSLKLFVWDRSREMMQMVSLTDRELDAHCGISIYRDGFRVLPYGEQGDDWLGLDARRINVPSKRVGNRNIVGLISISHDDNPLLRDKTSREGLMENHAYEALRALVRGAIGVFEIERLQDRVVQSIQITTPLTNYQLFSQPVFKPQKGEGAQTLQVQGSRHQSRAAVHQMVHQKKAQHEELFYLASVGLKVDRFAEQLSQQAQHAVDALGALQAQSTSKHLETLSSTIGLLRNMMRELAPDGVVSRAEQSTTFDVMEVVLESLGYHPSLCEQGSIDVRLHQDVTPLLIQSRRSCLVQMMDILLTNAVECLNFVKKPILYIQLCQDMIIVGDNGSGIRSEDRERIFHPYFTRNPESRGLGLYIARELAQSCGLRLFLLNSVEAKDRGIKGAAFCISLAGVQP